MKRLSIVLVCAVTIIYALSCSKHEDNNASCSGPKAITDSTALLAYAKTNGITTTADTSWMYYQIINPGTGASPNSSSIVFVRYAARLMDGTYVDSTATATGFLLTNLIKGWQYGLPKIKAGGQIKLLVPSALAYSCNGNGSSIPPNAPIYFNIYLDSLK
ncbi:MAG: FKBP-type peptidyl-prolyl cis-trans isomerase [Bacteroidota bacterium]